VLADGSSEGHGVGLMPGYSRPMAMVALASQGRPV